MTTAGPSSDDQLRAALLVSRLQTVHAGSAGEPAGGRQRRMAAMIEGEVAALAPERRSAVLGSVSGLVADLQGALRAAAGGAVAPDAGDDPNALTARLAALAPAMSLAQREVAQRQLAEVGLAPAAGSAGGGLGGGQIEKLRAGLRLGPDEQVDAARVPELLLMLVEFAASLDQLVWTTWRAVAPASEVKRAAPIKGAAGRFVAGDAGTREELRHELERLRQVTAALTAAVGQGGRQYAQKHCARVSPAEIERAVRDEGGRNVEERCWAKYRELAAGHDVDQVERELTAAVAAYAGALLRGATGPAR